jgi:hypothetical protein
VTEKVTTLQATSQARRHVDKIQSLQGMMMIVLDESNQEFDDCLLQLRKNSGSRGLHVDPIDTDLNDRLKNTLRGEFTAWQDYGWQIIL